MLWVLRLFLLLLTMGAVAAVAIRLEKAAGGGELQPKLRWPLALSGIPIIVFGLALLMSIGQIPAGQRGVVFRFGAVTDRTVEPGLYFVTPLVNSVVRMDVQTHAYEAKAAAASKDMQDVTTDVTINYRIDPNQVGKIYQTLGKDYLIRVVRPAVQESLKAATAKYDAEELTTKRAEAKLAAEGSLRDRLDVYGVQLEALSITNLQFSKIFTDAIESKVVAVQQALQAQNRLSQIQFEAQQAAAQAKGLADAVSAKGTGDAQSILTVAQAQAQANKLVTSALTEELTRYTLVQKLGPDIKVIVLPSGQNFILGADVLGAAAK